jgi:hypothetical protein
MQSANRSPVTHHYAGFKVFERSDQHAVCLDIVEPGRKRPSIEVEIRKPGVRDGALQGCEIGWSGAHDSRPVLVDALGCALLRAKKIATRLDTEAGLS